MQRAQERLSLQTKKSNLEAEAARVEHSETGAGAAPVCPSVRSEGVMGRDRGGGGDSRGRVRNRLELDETDEQKRARRLQVLELISDGEHLIECREGGAGGVSPSEDLSDTPADTDSEPVQAPGGVSPVPVSVPVRAIVGIQLKKAGPGKSRSAYVADEEAEAESVEDHRKRQRLAALEEEKSAGLGVVAAGVGLVVGANGAQSLATNPTTSVPKKDVLAPAAAMAAAFAKQYNQSQSQSTGSGGGGGGSELDKKAKQKRIVDSIPTDKDALFVYPVDWDVCVDNKVRIVYCCCCCCR